MKIYFQVNIKLINSKLQKFNFLTSMCFQAILNIKTAKKLTSIV